MSNLSSSPFAGKPATLGLLVDIPKLIAAYFNGRPDPTVPAQRIAFGTSGHRGSSFENSFNESHVLAISQAICAYRSQQNITGPLFLGFDTHALSKPAFDSALEVLAANGVDVMIADRCRRSTDDLVAKLIELEVDGEELTVDDICRFVADLLAGAS